MEQMAHYHHPLPYSGLALPQLGQGGYSCTCNPGRPHQSPKTNRDTPKTTEYFFVGLSLKYMASMEKEGSSSPFQSLLWSCPTSTQSRGAIRRTCIPGGPNQTNRDMPIISEYFFVHPGIKYVASIKNGWPSISTHNPTLVLPYLSWA